MADKINPSPEWAAKNVAKRLRKAAEARGAPVSAQVFVEESVQSDDLQTTAEQIVTETSKTLGLEPNAVRVGKVHPLAKSFSITSDSPEVFEEIIKRQDVKTILESEQQDIFPRPRAKNK